eukprot:TRINITY_DN1160_c0_g2_i1.p1 TRINITY_DN1160_c0_g2~~TRINITY_DN1160_c0_g2_i1.p1  ORF type:complete len:168 (-),score=30.04 TRINITY_DN1160_c0_g2_i1:234-737(-)
MSDQMHAMLPQEEGVEISTLPEDINSGVQRSGSGIAKRVTVLVLGLMLMAAIVAVVKPMPLGTHGHLEAASGDFVGLSSSSKPLCGTCKNPPKQLSEACPADYACNPAFMLTSCCMPLGQCPNNKPKVCTNPPNPLKPETFCGMGEACLATPFVGTGCCFAMTELYR